MTATIIRMQAKELAGRFYEENDRTPGFRKAFPTFRDYLQGRWHQPDGTIQQNIPGWQHHVVLAKRMLVEMLKQSDARVTPHMKNTIMDGLVRQREIELGSPAARKKSIAQVGIRYDA